MFNFLTLTLTTTTLTGIALIPGCQPTTKPACDPGATIEVGVDQETSCDLDGTNTLDEIYATDVTSFYIQCHDAGGIPIIVKVRQICKDRDF